MSFLSKLAFASVGGAAAGSATLIDQQSQIERSLNAHLGRVLELGHYVAQFPEEQ